jgi:hypothetical protein
MARRVVTIRIRLAPEDVRALRRARADGIPSSELIRRGLRIAAAQYYGDHRRPPRVGLFVSTDPHLGEESQLYKAFRE